jgi:S1-C subfamily serine protease
MVKPSMGVKSGDEVFTMGFPNVGLQGFEPKYTKGNISSVTGVQDDTRYFQISVPVQTGNSGGPLVDKNGNVVGVVVARLSDIGTLIETGGLPQNVNYAIKSSFILALLETMPQVYNGLKAGSEEKAGQGDLVEGVQKSVGLILCY